MLYLAKYRRMLLLLLTIVISLPAYNQVISGESKSYTFKIVDPSRSDKTGPTISVLSPQLEPGTIMLTDQLNLIIEGKAMDPSGITEIKINSKPINVVPGGDFRAMVRLEAGNNTISIAATDGSFNTAFSEFTIRRTATVSSSSRPAFVNTANTTGDYYALIIGIDEYNDEMITDLDQPVSDARKLYSILTEKYTFEKENSILLENCTRGEIIDNLDRLVNMVGDNDNLLVFYAGHGWWDDKRETGYWLPSDSKRSSTSNWLRNTTIQEYIDDIDSQHTLLIADACFSGGIFKTRSAFNDAPGSIEKLYELPSRKAMTSGNMKEVPDRSVFLQQLIASLNRNTSKYISSLQLFSAFRENVLNNSPNAPQYGVIQDTGDEGGEFIFILR